jgi:hypothetical protein
VEAAFPDRFSATRTRSLFAEALARPAQYVPNLAWLKAIAKVSVSPSNNQEQRRQRRNELLLTIEAVLQNHRRLQDSVATRQLGKRARPALTEFADPQFKLPLQMAFSDLATAIAREGRVAEAFDIANALGEPLQTATKIRASEQAMLTNNQRAAAYDSVVTFVNKYFSSTADEHSLQPARGRSSVAENISPLFYWFWGRLRSGIAFWYSQDLFSSLTGISEIINNASETNSLTLMAECRGAGLTHISGIAKQQIPDYESARSRQIYYNTILVGTAHLNENKLDNGWREYDEAELTQPADYDAPVY